MYCSRDMECDRHMEFNNSNSGPFFTLFPLTVRKIKILKKWKKLWRYYHFTHEYNKWRSFDVWFLRYGAQQTEFFVILGHCLPFSLLRTQKIKMLKTLKKHEEISSLYTFYFSFWVIFCPLQGFPQWWWWGGATPYVAQFCWSLLRWCTAPPPPPPLKNIRCKYNLINFTCSHYITTA